ENPLILFFLHLANDVEQLLDDEKLFFMNSNPGGLLKSVRKYKSEGQSTDKLKVKVLPA
ncbi:hypothetical protein Tco_0406630, partial [Tanacetum coccineum]